MVLNLVDAAIGLFCHVGTQLLLVAIRKCTLWGLEGRPKCVTVFVDAAIHIQGFHPDDSGVGNLTLCFEANLIIYTSIFIVFYPPVHGKKWYYDS